MLLHCKVFNVLLTVISILFFTSPYNLFVFQSIITNWRLVFFLYLLFITLYWFFSIPSLSLSLSPLATFHFPKFDNESITLNMHYYFFFFFFFNLVFLTWICFLFFVFHSSFDALGVRISVSLELLHLMWTILFI